MASANDLQRPVPTETFKNSYTVEVGGQTLQLDYHGDVHCPGNIFIYAASQKILMNVDVIFPGWVPFTNLAMASNMRGFLRGHDMVLGYDFDTFVPGHLSRLGNREDVEIQKQYFQDIVDASMKHFDDTIPSRYAFDAEFTFMDAAEVAGGWENIWLVYDTYLNTIADKVTAEVLPKWTGKLAAADVFTRAHALEIVIRGRVDG